MEKQCSKCRRKKGRDYFFNDSRYKDGKYPSCKECQKKATEKSILKKWGTKKNYYAEYRNRTVGNDPRTICAKKKCNARSHGIAFEFTTDEFEKWYNEQDLKCSYCDIPQDKISEYQWLMPNMNIHRLTIDRIENEKGYVKGNICLACARCNLIKSNILTYEQAREIGQHYIKPKWKN